MLKIARAAFFNSTRPSLVGLTNRHVDWPTVRNRASDPFDFTADMYKEVDKILKKYPETKKQSAVMALLHLAQRQCGGWIPLAAMLKVAEITQIPQKRVFEVATFYCMYNHRPVGKYHLQVCMTTPCMLRGSDEIMHALEHHLGVGEEEVTSDGLFSICEMECMGCCTTAPMICVSDYSNPPEYKYDYFEDLTVESAIGIVDSLKKGVYPKHGSQIGRVGAEPIAGKTSLFDPPPPPFCRELKADP
eukprot:NODE_3961_length_867_cov_311.962162_g3806_i0.p2 GENE.NODE_3961_length_867_cov_311.962162_g3806_i0~~NODE_3961_length_867_cov_311.962162_g3806_i0.p2  ORF type:complete len:270 (-),score=65.34 NODE_3961_length_867_cov_311.962162_g3806_i0:57-794(-)